MGRSLAEQLANKGLVTPDALQRLQSEQEVEAMNAAPTLRSGRSVTDDLDTAVDIYDFCAMAKIILTEEPVLIDKVLKKAHAKFPKRKDLHRRMYKLRDLLKDCPPHKRETMLNRALRRRDPVLEIPAD